jgi:linoleoyl-CoA desaturase
MVGTAMGSVTAPRATTGDRPRRVRYARDEEFRRVLQQRVRARLEQHPARENLGLLGQMVIAGVWFYASYAVLVFVPLPPWAVAIGVVSLGLATAGLLMMVVHTVTHRAVSSRRWLNDGIGWLTSASLAISPDWWQAKHSGLHHPFTNVVGFDDDIDLGSIARVTPGQEWKPWHRYQHIYAFVLSPLMYLNMVLTADLRFIFTGRVGARRVEQPTLKRTARLLAKKLGGVTVLLAVAFLQRPAIGVVISTVVAALIAGAVLAIVFQVQHCVEGTVFVEPDTATGEVGRSWAVTQAEAAADFGTGNRLLTWYSGALNYHVEHHLFPHVAHNRLPELRPIVRATCAEFGVHQVEFPTFRAAVRSHVRFLKRLGRRPTERSTRLPDG